MKSILSWDETQNLLGNFCKIMNQSIFEVFVINTET